MSIAPPSDIVLDVAQAADPQRVQEATARLARLAAGAPPGSAEFSETLSQVRSARAATFTGASPSVPDDRPTHVQSSKTSPYQKFEAMVLQNFVAAMLPQDNDLFGDAASAGPLRSMLADQLATQLSKSGRIGIAQMIERAHRPEGGASAAAAPPHDLPPRRTSA